MDRFVVRAPTWKTLEMSSFSRSFANVSLTGKKSTPKEDKTKPKLQSNKRLSIRDESLIKIFSSQPDEPLMPDRADNLSPVLVRYNGSFGGNGLVSNEKILQQSICLASNDENTPPPNAQITLNNEPVTAMSRNEDSNSRPSTPVANMIPTNFGSCTPKDHPFLARIQKDLNSPSAATRIRAIKALRSPTKSTYANFDVPYEEQDIITEEERKSPVKAKSIQELMKDVVVYVEVRTGEDNRSSGIKKVISALGAKVNDKLLRDTTHVVFKDGLLSTYNKAKKWNIPIVSILWIEACKKQMKLMSPNDYPISNADRYENPELYDKMKRYKSMQPDAEENRRQRTKVPPKENGVKSKPLPATPTSTTKKKTDITSFFTSLEKLSSTPSNSRTADTPVKTVSRTKDNFIDTKKSSDSLMKLAHLDTLSTLSDTFDSNSKPNNAKNTVDFENSENKAKLPETPRSQSRRRNSIQIAQSPQKSENSLVNSKNNVPVTPSTRNRRRTSFHIPASASVADCDKLQQKVLCSTIDEENAEDSVQNEIKRQTNFAEAPMNITKGTPLNKSQSSRRRTLYTPKAMEETKLQSIKETPSSRRRTVFNPSSLKLSDTTNMDLCGVSAFTPSNNKIPSSTLIGEECIKTPLQFGSLLEEHASATIFSSTKPATNPRRRTLFDVSMDIISQRLQNINQSAKSIREARPEDPTPDRRNSNDDPDTIAALLTPTESKNSTIRKELFTAAEDSATNTTTTPQSAAATTSSNAGETITKKKRKLFVPNDILLTPTSQPATADLSDATSQKLNDLNYIATPVATTKRRKTIMPTLTQPRSEQKKPAVRSNGSTASHPARRSTLDFEAAKKAKSAIKKASASSEAATETNNNNKPKPYPFLVYTNMHTEQIEFIKEAISKIQGFQLEDNVSDNTTHIVSLEPRRTINLLRGMVRGLWIVNYNWVVNSMKAGRWLDEEQYEMREFSRAVEICRSERQAFGSGYRMDLFSDLGGIYISAKSTIPCNHLKELVLLCAGRLADRRKRARYIVGDSDQDVVLPGKLYVEPQWILDSITHKQIQNPSKYISNLASDKKMESEERSQALN